MQRYEEPHAAREPQFGHPCYIVIARPRHAERISLRLYSLLVDFASALLRFAQVAYE